ADLEVVHFEADPLALVAVVDDDVERVIAAAEGEIDLAVDHPAIDVARDHLVDRDVVEQELEARAGLDVEAPVDALAVLLALRERRPAVRGEEAVPRVDARLLREAVENAVEREAPGPRHERVVHAHAAAPLVADAAQALRP